MKFKKILILFLLLLFIGGGVFIYITSRHFTRHLKIVVTNQLSTLIGHPVDIERVTTDIFNRIILNEIRVHISDEEVIRIRKIRIRYSLLKIVRNIRNINEIIKDITIFGPEFTAYYTAEGITILGLENLIKSADAILPPWRIRVVNGTLNMEGVSAETLILENVDGRLTLAAAPEIHINASFEIKNLIRKLNIEIEKHIITGDFNAELRGRRVELHNLDKLSFGELRYNFDKGISNFKTHIKGNIGELSKVKIRGEIDIINAEIEGIEIPKARLNISPEIINIVECIIVWKNNRLAVRGRVMKYLTQPELDISIKGNITARQLLEEIPFFKEMNIKNIDGIVEVDSRIEGAIQDIELTVKLIMSHARIEHLKIQQLKTSFSYKRGKINFDYGRLNFTDEAVLMWAGNWNKDNEIHINIEGRELLLEELTKIKDFGGRASGNIEITGTLDSPSIKTNITIEELALLEGKFSHITLKGFYENDYMKIDAFTLDGNYSAEGSFSFVKEEKKIVINKLSLNGLKDGIVNITGNIGYQPFESEITIKAEDINVKDITALTNIHPASSGSFNFEGGALIKKGNFEIKGNLWTDNFIINDSEYSLNSFLNISKKQEVTKFDINIKDLNRYLKGSLTISGKDNNYSIIKSSLTAVEADLRELFLLTGIYGAKQIKKGVLNGFFYHTSDEGIGEFTITSLKYGEIVLGDVHCLVEMVDGVWSIKKLCIEKDNSNIFASGQFYPIQNIEINISEYTINRRTITASLMYYGFVENDIYKFKMNINEAILSDVVWPDMEIKGNVMNGELSFDFTAQEYLKGEILLEFSDSKKIEGNIDIKDFCIEKILTAIAITPKSDFVGNFDGSLKIMETLKTPLIIATGNIKEGKFYNIKTSLSVSIEYQDGNFKIENIAGTLEENGIFNMAGVINRNKEMNIKSRLKNFNLKLLENIDKNLVEISGTASLDAEFSGTIAEPVIKINTTVDEFRHKEFKTKKLIANVIYSEESIEIERISALYGGGELVIDGGEIDISSFDKIILSIKGDFRNIDVGPITILGRAEISGTFSDSGNLLELKIIPENLLINRFNFVESFTLNYKDKTMVFNFSETSTGKNWLTGEIYFKETGEIEVRNVILKRDDKELSGTALYSDDKITANIAARNIELNNIIRLLNSPLNYHGKTNFNLDFKRIGEITDFSGEIEISNAEYAGIKIDTIKSAFSYKGANEVLKISSGIIRDAYFVDIVVDGSIGSDSQLKVLINRLSISVLEDLFCEVEKARGYFTGEFNVKGTVNNPDISGTMNLTGGKISGKNIIDRITSIESVVTASGSRLNTKLTADWRPGKISVSGYIDVAKRPMKLDFSLQTLSEKGIFVKIPYLDIPQSTIFGRFLTLPAGGEMKLDLRFFNIKDNYHLEGDIVASNTHFTYPPATGLREMPPMSKFLDDLNVNINITAGKSVWYENTYARLKVEGMLNFKKYRQGKLLINGEITSSEGTVTYFHRNFRVREVSLRFEDTVEYIFAVADTDIQRRMRDDRWEEDVIEMIILTSRVKDVVPKFNSIRFREDTTSDEALQFIIAGVEFDTLTQQQRNALIRREFLKAIDASLLSPLVRNILQRIELIDVAEINVKISEGTEEFNIYGAGLRIGRYVTDRFYLGYYMKFRPGVEDRLRLSHEIDAFYRLHGSHFLKGKLSREGRFFLGIEQRIRF